MKSFAVALALGLMLSGCGDSGRVGVDKFAKYSDAEAAAAPAMAGKQVRSRYMAYEHNVGFDVEEDRVAELHEAGRKACLAAAAENCVILNSRLETGRNANAELRMRMKPAGIDKIIAAMGDEGDIVRRSVSAEDLAAPIGDADRELARLKDYRERLEALRARASSDIESLIKVNEQLAQTQSQIEMMTGQHAELMQRVDTEILNISISSDSERSFWGPVEQAMSDFGANFSRGISSAITGLAFLLPWSLVVALFSWILRKLWMRWRKPA